MDWEPGTRKCPQTTHSEAMVVHQTVGGRQLFSKLEGVSAPIAFIDVAYALLSLCRETSGVQRTLDNPVFSMPTDQPCCISSVHLLATVMTDASGAGLVGASARSASK